MMLAELMSLDDVILYFVLPLRCVLISYMVTTAPTTVLERRLTRSGGLSMCSCCVCARACVSDSPYFDDDSYDFLYDEVR